MNPRILLAGAFLLVVTVTPAAGQEPKPAPAAKVPPIDVTLTPPADGRDGSLVVAVPQAQLIEALGQAAPESTDIPDQMVADDLLIYRKLTLAKLKAGGLKPSSMTLEGNVFKLAGTPTVTGELNALYEHVVVGTESKIIAGIKTDVPVVKRDWRPKGAAPFSITIDVRGTCAVSFVTGDTLKDLRLRLNTKADFVQIKDVTLRTEDIVYKAAEKLIGVAGKAFPNDGVNKPIKEALTRKFDLDPFKNLPAKDKTQLEQLKAKDVKVVTTATEVTVTAVLVPR